MENTNPYGKSTEKEKSQQWPQVLLILTLCLLLLTTGVLFSWTSPAIPYLISEESHIPMTFDETDLLTILPPITSCISGFIYAYFMNVIGRKKTSLFIALPQILSLLTISIATNRYMLYAARIMNGIAEGAVFTVITAYVSEISEPEVRGTWGNLCTGCIIGGQLLINVIATFLSFKATCFFCCIFPVLFMILWPFMPESPYFFIIKGRIEEARGVLKRLRHMNNVEDELSMLKKDVERQMTDRGTYKELLTSNINRKGLLISTVNRAVQQFSGIGTFSLYNQYIFQKAGGNISKTTSALIYQTTFLMCNLLAIFFVGKFGRRRPMFYSCLGSAIILAVESGFFYLDTETNMDVSSFGWVPLAGMITYLPLVSAGLGIIPTLMLGELFAANIKGKALGIMNIMFCLFLVLSTIIFQFLTSNFNLFAPFALYALCCLIGVPFSYFCIPETKGKTLEEIQQILRGKKNEAKNRTSNSNIENGTY